MHVLCFEKDPVGGCRRCLDKVLSSPFVRFGSDSYFEADVSLDQQRRLYTNGTICVDESSHHFNGVETTRYSVRRKKAGSRDVNNCSAQHVSGLRRKNERQMSRINIFVTSAEHDSLIYSEDVASRKAVRPASPRQISQNRGLAVRFVFIGLRSVASIEANLLKKQSVSINAAK